MNKIADKNSWGQLSPIDNPYLIEFTLVFTNEEVLKMMNGHIPADMDDRWFIYYEDGCLYFYRSWTGYGMLKAQIEKNESGYFINKFWTERNRNKNTADDYEDTWDLLVQIARSLLDIHPRVFLEEQNQRQNKIILE